MSRSSESDDAFDDLLWELDVTSVRPKASGAIVPPRKMAEPPKTAEFRTPWTHVLRAPAARPATQLPAVPPLPPSPQTGPGHAQSERRQPQGGPARVHRPARARLFRRREKARFARPELRTFGERLVGSRVVQGAGGALLLGGTSVLVVIALSRG